MRKKKEAKHAQGLVKMVESRQHFAQIRTEKKKLLGLPVLNRRKSQYSTQPASASHTFFTKLQLGKKEKKMEIDFR
eukprot:COSAG05_NODE_66_length_22253_cov_14.954455_11_plen_76_part_00